MSREQLLRKLGRLLELGERDDFGDYVPRVQRQIDAIDSSITLANLADPDSDPIYTWTV